MTYRFAQIRRLQFGGRTPMPDRGTEVVVFDDQELVMFAAGGEVVVRCPDGELGAGMAWAVELAKSGARSEAVRLVMATMGCPFGTATRTVNWALEVLDRRRLSACRREGLERCVGRAPAKGRGVCW